MREALSPPNGWSPRTGSTPSAPNVRETLCTVGNGYLGTRGTLEEGHLGDLSGHVPRRGVRRPRLPRDRPGQRAGLAVVRRVRRGHTARRAQRRGARPRAHAGPAHRAPLPAHGLRGRRRPSHPAGDAALRVLADRRTCALRVEITPENHDGEITVESAIDGGRRNLERLPGLPGGHARSRWSRGGRSGRSPATSTARSGGPTGTSRTWRCARSRAASRSATRRRPTASVEPTRSGFTLEDERVTWRAAFPGGPVRLDKIVRIGTSRDVDAVLGPGGLPRRARRRPGRGLRRDRRREPRGVGRALGRLRLHDRRRPGAAPRPCASASTTC